MEFSIQELALLFSALECLRLNGSALAADNLVDALTAFAREMRQRGTLSAGDCRLALGLCAKLRELATEKVVDLLAERAVWRPAGAGHFRCEAAAALAEPGGATTAVWPEEEEGGVMTTAPAEQRRHPRFPCANRTHSRLIAGVADCPVTVRDISRGGIGLAVAGRIDPEEVMTVRLYNRAWNFFLQLPFRVVYTVARVDGGTTVGGSFNRLLTEREVRELL
jgi:hypothetical protein